MWGIAQWMERRNTAFRSGFASLSSFLYNQRSTYDSGGDMIVRWIVLVTSLLFGSLPGGSWAQTAPGEAKTWKTVAELSPKERVEK
jgi:hypothetical protein